MCAPRIKNRKVIFKLRYHFLPLAPSTGGGSSGRSCGGAGLLLPVAPGGRAGGNDGDGSGGGGGSGGRALLSHGADTDANADTGDCDGGSLLSLSDGLSGSS